VAYRVWRHTDHRRSGIFGGASPPENRRSFSQQFEEVVERMIDVRAGDAPEIEAELARRIYEYNANATGYCDGESFTAVRRSESGDIEAGISGYTWGGCCYVAYLWVAESLRGQGIGTELLNSVEQYARGKACVVIFVSTHSFQAPAFYARHGYDEVARVSDHPVGHASLFYAKRLAT
jgi:GNAT superfamily N-acetyltransferase